MKSDVLERCVPKEIANDLVQRITQLEHGKEVKAPAK
jgi:hypothetical protein